MGHRMQNRYHDLPVGPVSSAQQSTADWTNMMHRLSLLVNQTATPATAFFESQKHWDLHYAAVSTQSRDWPPSVVREGQDQAHCLSFGITGGRASLVTVVVVVVLVRWMTWSFRLPKGEA